MTGADGNAPFSVKAAKLTLWSPESPKLYTVTLASGEDKLTDNIGFRDIRVDGTRILLNGKAVFLQGANMHAEAPVRGGRANTDKDVATIFSYLKDLNANFVRLAHYPHDERMERAADQGRHHDLVGDTKLARHLLWQTRGLHQRYRHAQRDDPPRPQQGFGHTLVGLQRNLEQPSPHEIPYRPRRSKPAGSTPRASSPPALNSAHIEGTNAVLNDPLANVLDVVGVNEYIGWYGGLPEDADKMHWTLPQKPIIMSEFGSPEAETG